jgi:hypothetical protein
MKMSLMRLILAIMLAVAATHCGKDDMPKYQNLGDLRILNIVVDKPEANPGDTVTFTPILSDLNGNGRTINYAVQACVDPGIERGVEPVCTSPDPSSIQTGTVAIPAGASNTYTDAVSSFTLTMPDAATMFSGGLPSDQYNGVIYLVQYNINVTNGPAINSFLRVFVSDPAKTQKNLNPVVTSVDENDVPVSSPITMPSSGANFRVTFPASSMETYQVMQYDGSFLSYTEEMLDTWFISDGAIDYSRTTGSAENFWAAPGSKPAGRGMVLLVVTRDGRGGSAFRKIEMN